MTHSNASADRRCSSITFRAHSMERTSAFISTVAFAFACKALASQYPNRFHASLHLHGNRRNDPGRCACTSSVTHLFADSVLALHNDELAGEFAHTLHDFERMQIRWLSLVDAEDFLCVPDQSVQVAWQHHLSERELTKVYVPYQTTQPEQNSAASFIETTGPLE